MSRPVLEVCVADAASLDAAVAGGADRIELCAALELGGLTPTPGFMRLAAAAPVPVYAMVRPRSGDFAFDTGDIAVMLRDIVAIREAGLAGVVLGASRPDGRLDAGCLAQLVAASAGLGRTLHRAFDLVPDVSEAVETAVALGFERILTSGRQPTAPEGIEDLGAALTAARGRVTIMAGAGVTAETAGPLLARLPLTELHGSCSVRTRASDGNLAGLGLAEASRRTTDAASVRRLRAALHAAVERRQPPADPKPG